MELPKVGQVYEHYRTKDEYRIIALSKDEEHPEQILVTYESLNDNTDFRIKPWTRKLEVFLEEIDLNGEKMPRFKLKS